MSEGGWEQRQEYVIEDESKEKAKERKWIKSERKGKLRFSVVRVSICLLCCVKRLFVHALWESV